MHLHPEDSPESQLDQRLGLPPLTVTELNAALRGALDALECHAKVLRRMTGRVPYQGDCLTRQSFLCEAERAERQSALLSLLVGALEDEPELRRNVVAACSRKLGSPLVIRSDASKNGGGALG